jgi:hypothetical protein
MARMPTLFVSPERPLRAPHDDEPGVRIHSSYDRGLLPLDVYAFGLTAPVPREIRVLGPATSSTLLH